LATYFSDLSLALFHEDVIRPQTISSDGQGSAVDVATVGANLLTGRVSLGAVSSLTSLVVTFEASPTGSGSWVACTTPNGTNATVTLTAANTDGLVAFQLPTAASSTADPYRYVRANWDITGTNCVTCGSVFGLVHMPNPNSGYTSAPPTIN
jgi:hypothetical protein